MQVWHRHPFILILAASVLLLASAGCATQYTKNFQKSEANYGSRTGREPQVMEKRLYGPIAEGSNHHQNRELKYSPQLSTAVSDMAGVFHAIVMETDRNAYAAIIYDSTATGTKSSGYRDNETDNTGMSRGMYDVYTGSPYADPNKIVTGINGYYTAVDEEDLSHLFKQRIAAAIRRQKPHLSEVHISANRDFVNQMNVYWNEAVQGVDLNRYLDDFNKLAEKTFGTAKSGGRAEDSRPKSP